MPALPPINFSKWIEENKHKLQPPVGAFPLYQDSTFVVMAVGGPNRRTDYHINQTDEFFYQYKGDMILKVCEDGVFRDIPIKEGELFVLPANTPHSPQRFENTVGLVIESKRAPDAIDQLQWYCDKCKNVIVNKQFHVEGLDLGAKLKPLIEEYYASDEQRTCKECGNLHQPPAPVK
ncbi:hypothetical protein PROFUN_11854 [Planoprotostelium fungivorum]|uniref:3-hydroxyanthranilate 3,4-dioxygenase n=1 Tax=Planoprotostelium fungivorum TaxID=1890364 RepID=A0A2P6N9C5_9EUKA|nr:hypothetical protein PROFUN_11854 [Planoprotostelium fungivorum]